MCTERLREWFATQIVQPLHCAVQTAHARVATTAAALGTNITSPAPLCQLGEPSWGDQVESLPPGTDPVCPVVSAPCTKCEDTQFTRAGRHAPVHCKAQGTRAGRIPRTTFWWWPKLARPWSSSCARRAARTSSSCATTGRWRAATPGCPEEGSIRCIPFASRPAWLQGRVRRTTRAKLALACHWAPLCFDDTVCAACRPSSSTRGLPACCAASSRQTSCRPLPPAMWRLGYKVSRVSCRLSCVYRPSSVCGTCLLRPAAFTALQFN